MALDTVEVSYFVKSSLRGPTNIYRVFHFSITKSHVYSPNPPFDNFLLNYTQRLGQTSSPGVPKPYNPGMRFEAHGQ